MNEEHVLDLTQLRTTIKNIFSTAEAKKVYPFSEEDFFRVIKQEEIDFTEKKDAFFCPVFLMDVEENRKYPVFFFPADEEKKDKLNRKENSYPIYSLILDEFFQNKNFQISKDHRLSDIPSYLFSLKSMIENSDYRERLSLEYSLSFYSSAEILFQTIYVSMPEYFASDALPKKYLGFLKKNHDEDTEKKLTEDNQLYFSPFLKVFDSMEGYGSAKVVYQNERDRNLFLLYFLNRQVSSGKNVLIVTDDQNDMRNLIRKYSLDRFAFDFVSFHATEISESDFALTEKTDYSEIIEKKRELNQARSEYLNLAMQKQNLYIHPSLENDLQNLLYQSQFEGIDPFDIDLEDYSEEDFKKDLSFIKDMDKYQSILSKPLMQNSLYGLTLSSKKENYDLLVLTSVELYSKTEDFVSFLKKRNMTNLSTKEIRNFRQFIELGKDMDVLAEYNGFPKRYFKIEDSEKPEARLEDLRNLYKAVSSSKLMVDNLFSERIYQMNIDRLTREYQEGFLKRNKTKKILRYYLKNPKNVDYDLIIRILKHYRKAILLLNEALPVYQEAYGDSVLNMNGLVEIQSNIKYLEKFRNRGKFNPYFNIDNPKIKKAIREKDYRNELVQDYKEASQKYENLSQVLKRYSGFFSDFKKDYLGMDFSDLLEELRKKQSITYPIFYEYSTFKKNIQGTSFQFQLKVREYTANDKTLSLFRNRYLLSLYHAIYISAEKESKAEEKNLREACKNYFKLLEELPTIKKEMLKRDMEDSIHHNVEIIHQNSRLTELLYHLRDGVYTENDIRNSYHLYEKTHPICLASFSDLSYSFSDQFDSVVILNSSHLDDLPLFGSMDCGKKVLFVNPQQKNDIRLQGYDEILISNDTMYLSRFRFDHVPHDFVEYMKAKVPLLGYKFLLDDQRFCWIMVDKNDPKRQFALIPDACVPMKYRKETLTQLREYLYVHYGLHVISFVVFEALFEKEKFLEEALSLFRE